MNPIFGECANRIAILALLQGIFCDFGDFGIFDLWILLGSWIFLAYFLTPSQGPYFPGLQPVPLFGFELNTFGLTENEIGLKKAANIGAVATARLPTPEITLKMGCLQRI